MNFDFSVIHLASDHVAKHMFPSHIDIYLGYTILHLGHVAKDMFPLQIDICLY
jgi:hypothetical protein